MANKIENKVQFEEVLYKIFKYGDVGQISEILCEDELAEVL